MNLSDAAWRPVYLEDIDPTQMLTCASFLVFHDR